MMRSAMLLEWVPEDEIYVVTVPELPGCLTHGRTLEDAIDQGKDAIESWIDAAARARNIRIPEPRLFAGGRR